MSTTSENSSIHADFPPYQDEDWFSNNPSTSQQAAFGQFHPLPVSNADFESPIFKAKSMYKSVADVIKQYQDLFEKRWEAEFPHLVGKVPAPSLSMRLDFLWIGYSQEVFRLLKEHFDFHWELVLCADLPTDKGARVQVTFPLGYETLAYSCCEGETIETCYTEKAKVRFRCQNCNGNAWTSMHGRVDFRFVKSPYAPQSGVVFFRLYNQKCQKCNCEVQVLWFDDEIIRVLTSLYFYMVQAIHHAVPECVRSPIAELPAQGRLGNPMRPHIKQLCSACQDGACRSRAVSRAMTPTIPPVPADVPGYYYPSAPSIGNYSSNNDNNRHNYDQPIWLPNNHKNQCNGAHCPRNFNNIFSA